MLAASRARLPRRAGAARRRTRVEEAFGDAIFLNVFLLGAAFQRGLLPLSPRPIDRALELNGTAVARNQAAFALGRAAALEPPRRPPRRRRWTRCIARRAADLTAYQNAGYARGYADFVARVRAADSRVRRARAAARAVAVQLTG